MCCEGYVFLGRGFIQPRFIEYLEVVGGTYQRPLRFDTAESVHRPAPEAHSLFDVGEGSLDDRAALFEFCAIGWAGLFIALTLHRIVVRTDLDRLAFFITAALPPHRALLVLAAIHPNIVGFLSYGLGALILKHLSPRAHATVAVLVVAKA